MKDQQKIIIEIQGKIYKDLSLTIGSLIDGKQKEIIVKILADDNQISQCRLNQTNSVQQQVNSTMGKQQPFNTNQRQVQGKRDEPNLRRVKLQQSKNSLASRPVTAVQQMRPISKLTFQNYQTQVKTQVQLTTDQTLRQAIELLSKLIDVLAQSIIVYNHENTQLQNNQLQAKVSQFQDGNNQYTYKLTDQAQKQASENGRITMNFLVEYRHNPYISLSVEANMSMIEIKEILNECLGYKGVAEIAFYNNDVLIPPGKLSHTPAELNLINDRIKIRVSWYGGLIH